MFNSPYSNQMVQNPYINQYQPQQMIYQQPQYNQSYNQQPLQSFQNNLSGRLVNSQSEIKADEIPMNGSVGFFPKSDYSEIYAKSWNAMNGNIDTVIYKPVNLESEKPVPNNNFEEQFESLKTELLDRFDKLEKSLKQTNKKPSAKDKEATNES